MKTNVAPTSLAAYRELEDTGDLTDMETLVYLALAFNGPMTREEIGHATGMKEGSACGRVAKLMEKDRVVHFGYKTNPVTGKPNEIVELVAADRAKFPLAMAA